MGGFFEGRLHFMDDSFKERALKMLGSDINNLWSADDLVDQATLFYCKRSLLRMDTWS